MMNIIQRHQVHVYLIQQAKVSFNLPCIKSILHHVLIKYSASNEAITEAIVECAVDRFSTAMMMQELQHLQLHNPVNE